MPDVGSHNHHAPTDHMTLHSASISLASHQNSRLLSRSSLKSIWRGRQRRTHAAEAMVKRPARAVICVPSQSQACHKLASSELQTWRSSDSNLVKMAAALMNKSVLAVRPTTTRVSPIARRMPSKAQLQRRVVSSSTLVAAPLGQLVPATSIGVQYVGSMPTVSACVAGQRAGCSRRYRVLRPRPCQVPGPFL